MEPSSWRVTDWLRPRETTWLRRLATVRRTRMLTRRLVLAVKHEGDYFFLMFLFMICVCPAEREMRFSRLLDKFMSFNVSILFI